MPIRGGVHGDYGRGVEAGGAHGLVGHVVVVAPVLLRGMLLEVDVLLLLLWRGGVYLLLLLL